MLSNYIYPHLTGNDKGLYATMKRWRIDPWLYGDIRNLHLRFQQLYLLCRQPRHIHDRRFILGNVSEKVREW